MTVFGGTRIKPVAKSGDEMEVTCKHCRRMYCWTQRPGSCARTKRAMRRRLRHALRILPILGTCILILGMSGCDDRGECLASHQSLTMMPNYIYGPNGQISSVFFVPIETTVCDRWQFPSGRPK